MAHYLLEPMSDYMGCEAMWPATTTTTEKGGCCIDSDEAIEMSARATDRARCEDMGCPFLVPNDCRVCEMTINELLRGGHPTTACR